MANSGRTAILAALVAIGSIGLYAYYASGSHAPSAADEEKTFKQVVADRLSSSGRTAKVLVLGQTRDAQGVTTTSCLFIEYAADGKSLLGARRVQTPGNQLTIDTCTLVFHTSDKAASKLLEGRQAMLFVSAGGLDLEKPGQTPDFYRGDGSRVLPAQQKFWTDAWKATQDPVAAAALNCSVNNRQAQLALAAGGLYDIWIEPGGGVGISEEALSAKARDMLMRSVAP